MEGAAAFGLGKLAQLVHDGAAVIGAGAKSVETGDRHWERLHDLQLQVRDEVCWDLLSDLGLHVQGHVPGDVQGVGQVARDKLNRIVLMSGCK